MGALVNWDLAGAAGARLVRPGPEVAADEARAHVEGLYAAAAAAEAHVRAVTGLVAPTSSPVEVVDRPRWVRANAGGFGVLLDPVEERLLARAPGPAVQAVGSTLTALETGAVLAWLAARVLGQFEVAGRAADGGEHQGRLLLVAPNILQAQRSLRVDPADFRLWVCLHEETHRVQFGGVPWMRGHVLGELRGIIGSLETEPGQWVGRMAAIIRAIGSALIGRGAGGVAAAVLPPAQRERLTRLAATMALLEGHADYVMDEVGPQVVPSVVRIRSAFNARRANAAPVEGAMRRLLGMDEKLRQYREGAAFVRGVHSHVGAEGFAAVWSAPQALPSSDEIAHPERWVARVHGPAAVLGAG